MGVYEGRVQMPKAIENSSQAVDERFGWGVDGLSPLVL
jgi:hypothetical protein